MSGGFTPNLKRSDVAIHGKASFLASEKMRVKRGGITLDASLVPADENGNKVLEAGQFVAEATDSGKYGPYAGLTSESATLAVNATGGTYALTVAGQKTGAIAYNASAAQVQAAIEALPGIDEGDVTVTAGTPMTLTFGGEYGNENVAPDVSADSTNLTGGTHTATVTTTQGGAAVPGLAAPSADTSGYLLEAVNLKDGDVICGLLIEGSVLAARVTPAPDATIRAAVKGRIQFQ